MAGSRITGELRVAGDKSIAHRALILAALAEGESEIQNFPAGEAVQSTSRCLRCLGVKITAVRDTAIVHSSGSLSEPRAELYAGNSGTTMRLLTGILAGQSFACSFTGDPLLSKRPMTRIVEPLSLMGGSIESRGGRPPLRIKGRKLSGVRYTLPIASAQVKSCILLAGLVAEGETVVSEKIGTRDHTERLFEALHLKMSRHDGTIQVTGPQRPEPFSLNLPGDISSAAFFLTAAALTDAEVRVRDVGVNPGRIAFLRVLQQFGVRVQLAAKRDQMGEPVADIVVSGRPRNPIELHASDVPSVLDELPLIALLASQADGISTVDGAHELRFKETDRIRGVVTILARLGANVEELQDGFKVNGPAKLSATTVDSQGDHRLAMMAAIAGAIASGEVVIHQAEASAVSFPEFARDFEALGGRIHVN